MIRRYLKLYEDLVDSLYLFITEKSENVKNIRSPVHTGHMI